MSAVERTAVPMTITIFRSVSRKNCYDVHVGERFAYELTFEEVLGVVACAVVPRADGEEASLPFLRTVEEEQAWRQRLRERLA